MAPPDSYVPDTTSLLCGTEPLASTLYHHIEEFPLRPERAHRATLIEYDDILENREKFLNELINTVIRYVFSKEAERGHIAHLLQDDSDQSRAYTQLYNRAKAKFRPVAARRTQESVDISMHGRGQFAELLLFNLLQHYFRAAPLVRKMALATSASHERYGADAIHVRNSDGRLKLFVGESKVYAAQSRSFPNGFKACLSDGVEHAKSLHSELGQYGHDDFLPRELQSFARDFLDGRVRDIELNIVCLLAYESTVVPEGRSREDCIQSLLQALRADTSQIRDTVYQGVDDRFIERTHYIFFPINDVQSLINDFCYAL